MKHFIIKYRFQHGSPEEWHQHIAAFIAALEADPELSGRIGYRVMKQQDSADYTHLASAADDAAIKTLQSRAFFQRYTAQTKAVAGGAVEVSPLEILGEAVLPARAAISPPSP
jgi:quinol monooxygenase YgiN